MRPDRWDAARNKTIAGEVGELNQILSDEGRRYVLIGPGRWGSADEWLGIPVQWSQISNVKVLVEASPSSHPVEPSQGAHFFQNMTALEIGHVAAQHVGHAVRLHPAQIGAHEDIGRERGVVGIEPDPLEQRRARARERHRVDPMGEVEWDVKLFEHRRLRG